LGWRWCHSLMLVWLLSHSYSSPRCFSPQIFPASGNRGDSLGSNRLRWVSLIPVSKVFLTKVSGKCVLFKCVNDSISEGRLWVRYSWLKMLLLSRGSVPCGERLSLEGRLLDIRVNQCGRGTLTWGGNC